MLLPIARRVYANLVELDIVQIKPLGPPLNIDFNSFTYEYDNTKWKMEQRRLKIEKLNEKIHNKYNN